MSDFWKIKTINYFVPAVEEVFSEYLALPEADDESDQAAAHRLVFFNDWAAERKMKAEVFLMFPFAAARLITDRM